jgi:xylulokinase
MEQIGAPPKRLVAVGGGARNRAWLQMVTDISGREQIVPDTTVGASYGDAFLAGLATGIVPSLDALAGSWVKPKAVIAPDPAAQHAYNPYYRVFRSLYEHARDDLHALARLGSGA